MSYRRQFAFRSTGLQFEIGLIRDDNQFIEIAVAKQQSWANDITLALNAYQPEEEEEKVVDAD